MSVDYGATIAVYFLSPIGERVVGQFDCAMAAGVTDRLWEMKDLVEMLEAFEAAKKRAA